MILDLHSLHNILFTAEAAKSFFLLPNVKNVRCYGFQLSFKNVNPVPIHAEGREERALTDFHRERASPGGREFLRHQKNERELNLGELSQIRALLGKGLC